MAQYGLKKHQSINTYKYIIVEPRLTIENKIEIKFFYYPQSLQNIWVDLISSIIMHGSDT